LSLIEIARLSEEQQAQLAGYGERWARLRSSIAACDRKAAEAGVMQAYAAVGLPPPRDVVWAGGPVEIANSWARVRNTAGDNVRSVVVDLACRKAEASVDRAVGLAVRVSLASEPRLSRVPPFCASIDEAVLRDCERMRPHLRTWLAGLSGRNRQALLSFASAAYSFHSAPTLGPLEYFHDVTGLQRQTEALQGLWQIARHASWIVPHRHVCWLAERPRVLRQDARARLHCGDRR
jgi:hypothetical protein